MPDLPLTDRGVPAMGERAVRPNPAGTGAPWVVSPTLTDEDVEELFGRDRWPRNGLHATLDEAKAALLSVEAPRLDPKLREAIELAKSWQELVRAIYHGPGEDTPWGYALHKATGLHADFLAYIADPLGVPGPFVFWAVDDEHAFSTAAWPWEGVRW